MFHNEDELKKQLAQLNIDTNPNPKHRENLRRQMLSAFNETHADFWHKFGRAIVRRPIKKLAVVAATIFIVLAGTYYLGSPIDGTTVAWGEVMERIKKTHTFSAQSKRTFTVVGEEKPVLECDVYKYFSPDYGYMEKQYIDGELGMLTYGLFKEKLMIFVFPTMKKYLRLKLDEQALLLIEHINPMNPEALIELFGPEKCKRLGSKEINGIKADGIEVKDLKVFLSVPRFLFQLENIDIRLWTNPETSLPIEMEAEGVIGKGLLTGFKDMTGKSVMHKIEYDVKLDASIFEPSIPDDYTLLDVKASLKKAGAIGAGILLLGIVICIRLRKGRKKYRYTNPQRIGPQQKFERTITKSPITKLAAAAVIIIAVIIGVNHFSGSIDGATKVWANTLERIHEATSVTYKKTFEGDKADPFYFKVMINENGAIRSEIGGMILIDTFAKRKTLQLIPSRKEAILTYYVGQKRHARPYNQLDWLVSIKDRAGEFLGTEDVNGTQAHKFCWQRGEYENTTVWVDPYTNFPVKVKETHLSNPNKDIIPPYFELSLSDFGGPDGYISSMGGSADKGIQEEMIIIMKNFIWNRRLDPSLFSTEPPEDYTVREKHHDVSELGENGLIQALSFWTEMSDGYFPDKINDLIDPNQINPMLIKKFNGDGDPLDELEEAMKQASIIGKGLMFAQEKKANNNWHYAGNGVHLGESDAVVCWWKQEDSNEYRVIYGDLSIGTVPAEQLPE